jgi:hypothetical protein
VPPHYSNCDTAASLLRCSRGLLLVYMHHLIHLYVNKSSTPQIRTGRPHGYCSSGSAVVINPTRGFDLRGTNVRGSRVPFCSSEFLGRRVESSSQQVDRIRWCVEGCTFFFWVHTFTWSLTPSLLTLHTLILVWSSKLQTDN